MLNQKEISKMIESLNGRLELAQACRFCAEIHRDDAPKFLDRIAVWDDYGKYVVDEKTFRKCVIGSEDYEHAHQILDGR